LSSSPPVVYLFAGDSLTEGTFGESFVERVSRNLSRPLAVPCIVVNAGRGGDTVRSLLDRIGSVVREAMPHWVILAVGTNDVWFHWVTSRSLGWALWMRFRQMRTGQIPTGDLDQFAAVYQVLLDRTQAAGVTHVLACTASPLGEDLASLPNRRVAAMNAVIRRVATDRSVPVADVWQAFVEELVGLPNPSRYLTRSLSSVGRDARLLTSRTPDVLARQRRLRLTFDGIHLNSQGADLWADTIARALVQVQGRPA
jgi:lysophospholipase L1-like esterase